jgi:hypothetical protein
MMKLRWFFFLGVATILLAAITANRAEADTATRNPPWAPAKLLRRCEKNYTDDEIADMVANGEDGYEPDDCPFLAHVLTGPMLLNFCQPGDEDWIIFMARANMIYQIRAEPQSNYPTEPHLDLFEGDGRSLIAQNDHYFGNNAEVWWWNTNAERFIYIRATELRGRHDCGNSAYTLSLHSFTENPYPQATVQPSSTPALTPTITTSLSATETLTSTIIATPPATETLTTTLSTTPSSTETPTSTLTTTLSVSDTPTPTYTPGG